MGVLTQIVENKIVAIIRGAYPADVLDIANALYNGGIKLVEITMNSPGALLVIEEVAEQMRGKVTVGAGTVLDPETARAAISAGAQFIISPNLNVEVIKETRRYGAVSIPGAYTPTEILMAYEHGGDIIKVFPAPGPDYIKNIRGPLAQIPLMPTGGVNAANIAEYQKAGAVAFGVGSALVDLKQHVTPDDLQKLTERARMFVQAIATGT